MILLTLYGPIISDFISLLWRACRVMELGVLAAALAVVLGLVVYALMTGVAPAPTSPRVASVMLDLIPPGIEGVVFELGSGWGNLAFPLARRLPRCTVRALEISPLPWLFSKVRHRVEPLTNLSIRRADFHPVALGDAALVVCYLFPARMDTLKTKLEAELKPGAYVLSNTFSVPGWRPEAVRRADDLYATTVYLYRMPE